MTQKQIANEIGVARTTYTNIELGTKNPSLKLAMKIKEVLGVKEDYIFLNIDVPI